MHQNKFWHLLRLRLKAAKQCPNKFGQAGQIQPKADLTNQVEPNKSGLKSKALTQMLKFKCGFF